MKLLKLVIVDDEPILLQGLLDTYDWADMGFKVVGSAQSGEQAIEVIKETKPHVVLTDIPGQCEQREQNEQRKQEERL